MGTLRIKGTIDVAQFWPKGNSDADTTQLEINVTTDSFEYAANDKTYKRTNVYNKGKVTGRGGTKDVISYKKKKNIKTINVRLQGVDAPELHYAAPPLPSNSVSDAVRKKYNDINEDFRQPYGENAAYALGSFLKKKANAQGIVQAEFISKNIDVPADALDTFGRFVGNISIGNVDINLWLAQEGWVIPTFYGSMSKSEIDAVLKACTRGERKKRALSRLTYNCSTFQQNKVLRRKVVDYNEGSDAGPVLVPKLFRRVVNYRVAKGAGVFKSSFLEFVREKAKNDTFMTVDNFLEHGSGTADQHRIEDFLKGNTFTAKIDKIVFKEGASTLKDANGKKVTKF